MYANPFDLDTTLAKGIFAFPGVHLLTFECLRRLFLKITGKKPLITTFSSIRSRRAEGGLFSKSRTRRRLRFSDYVFTTLQALMPFVLLFGTWIFLSPSKRVFTPSAMEVETVSHSPMVWFEPINDPNKPDWEILPQEAKAGEVILSKRNELGILSNFAATPFVLDGKRYASVEGFWQMMLYPEGTRDERVKDKRVTWKYSREQVSQMTAFEAKQAGTLAEENMKTLGIDWVTYNGKRFPYRSPSISSGLRGPGEHYRLIVAAMRAKLEQNPEVKRILLATGDLILKPDHHTEANPPPEWKYYEIWMQLRTELQKAKN